MTVTDDNSLVEAVRHPVRLVECGAENIKITTAADMIVAEGILKSRMSESDAVIMDIEREVLGK